MKKTKIILLLVIILSLVSIAAAVEKRMGEQIEIVSANDGLPFDAHTPFHIAHGWSWYTIMGTANLNGGAPGRNQFTLEVDLLATRQHHLRASAKTQNQLAALPLL